jgi:hypothetical protein
VSLELGLSSGVSAKLRPGFSFRFRIENTVKLEMNSVSLKLQGLRDLISIRTKV